MEMEWAGLYYIGTLDLEGKIKLLSGEVPALYELITHPLSNQYGTYII